MAVFDTGHIDVVILCGGQGKRLKSLVSDRPKPMAEINNKPFLDILIEHAVGFGFKRFILCTGHKTELIEEYYKKTRENLEILISSETEPLGTAGAVKNAQNFIRSSPFIVMNGDSFCSLDLSEFIDFHQNKKALISIALSNSEENKDYGSITLSASQRIIKFKEKSKDKKKSFVNAGIYLFNKDVLSLILVGKKTSLEYDFFPSVVDKEIYGYVTDKHFLDIGVPERYLKAKKYFSKQARVNR